MPKAPFLEGLAAYLEDKRPLTDALSISLPEVVDYDMTISADGEKFNHQNITVGIRQKAVTTMDRVVVA